MKVALLVLACLCIVISTHAADTYDSKYDSIDIDSILANPRVLTNYIKCLMDNGPCTKEGRQLKKDLPDALETNCSKCTDSQKKIIRKAINHIKEKRPDDWQKLIGKFDADKKYVDQFNKFLQETD